jgi:hypothetical protein
VRPSDDGTIFVLKFFYTRSGELRCRVSDTRTSERRVIDDPGDVKVLLKAVGVRSLTSD